MSETTALPRGFQILYYEKGEWNLVELHISVCKSFYFARNSFSHDTLHECKTLRDLLTQYGIMTVVCEGRHVILNRGDMVERLKTLITAQEQSFDRHCAVKIATNSSTEQANG